MKKESCLCLAVILLVLCASIHPSPASEPVDCSISINDGATHTAWRSVVLGVHASGAYHMSFKNSATDPWSPWEAYATLRDWMLSNGADGERTVWVRFKDNASNISDSESDTIILDSTAPSNGSLSINDGAVYTNSPNVSLTVSATGATHMRFSNDYENWSNWELYAANRSGWALSGSVNGIYAVFVQFRDAAYNISDAFISDSITLDVTAPAGAILINDGATYTNSANVGLTLSAAGASQVRFKNEGGAWSDWENYSNNRGWTLGGYGGAQTVYAELRDAAGNVSPIISDSIILDTVAPADCSISINEGATHTNNLSVALTLAATGASQMRFSSNQSLWSLWENYNTTKVWTLTSGDGAKYVYAQFRDSAGNVTDWVVDGITLDQTAPTGGSVIINGGAAYTASPDVTLALSASLATQMRFSNNNSAWSAWQDYATSKVWPLPGSDGLKTVFAQFRDEAGNISSTVKDSITLDTEVPTGTITISNNAANTNTRSVALTLFATGASQMRFKNDDGLWSGWEAYSTGKAWLLDSTEGTRTVWVQFRDAAGNISASASDSINLDTTAPSGTMLVNGGSVYTNTIGVTLTLSSSDAAAMRLSNDNSSWASSSWEPYATTRAWTLTTGDGSKTVYAQLMDASGNVSTVSDSITLSTTEQTGTVLINGGSAFTNDRVVTLALSSPGAIWMHFSNSSTFPDGWLPYAAGTSWTLTAGEGSKTVYVQFKNVAGTISEAVTDSIMLDTTPPTGSILINGGATHTNSTSVTLSLSAVGASQMCFSNDGVFPSPWEPYASSKIWTIESVQGSKSACVKFRDMAGNESLWICGGIIFDDIPPTRGTVLINGGEAYTSSANVNLDLLSVDGASWMRFSNDNVTFSPWEVYVASKSWVLSPGNGIRTVYAQYMDTAGNISNVASDTITLDTIAPTGGAIAINFGATHTTDINVTVDVAVGGASEMSFSHDNTNWFGWEPYSAVKYWTLTSGDGVKTVYALFRDEAGNISNSATDTIILDRTAPNGTVAINNGAAYTNSTFVTLQLSVTEPYEMRFSSNNQDWYFYEAYESTRVWGLTDGEGLNMVYVRFRDQAGNESGVKVAGITLDTTAPTGSMTINDGAASTSSTSVSIGLSVTGASEMRFSNDNTNWPGWEVYNGTKSWILASGDGAKTVYAQLRDEAGNELAITDDITLETGAPTNCSMSINGGAAYTVTPGVTLTLTAVGATQMRFSNNNTVWSPWQSYGPSRGWNLPTGDGTKRVYAQFKDDLGNSVLANHSITLDTTAPTNGSISINNGAAYASDVNVTLTLSATGASQMCFSNDDNTWSDWEAYAASKDFSLAAGGGPKTVYARYRDDAGNVSASVRDDIILGTPASPAGAILLLLLD